MPTYEFLCQKCKKSFELLQSMAEHERSKNNKIKCPKCNSVRVVRQISTFGVNTSKKS